MDLKKWKLSLNFTKNRLLIEIPAWLNYGNALKYGLISEHFNPDSRYCFRI